MEGRKREREDERSEKRAGATEAIVFRESVSAPLGKESLYNSLS